MLNAKILDEGEGIMLMVGRKLDEHVEIAVIAHLPRHRRADDMEVPPWAFA